MVMFDYKAWEERQQQFQKVFEALQKRDFEMAKTLVPKGYKLCGYQEFSEPFKHEEYGVGWAGQFEDTEVAPGLYPVFACEYYYNEVERNFTNHLKDYPGIMFWYIGKIVASSVPEFVGNENHIASSSPYCHAVAKNILEGKSKVQLLSPFEAKVVPFEYDGEKRVTYQIVDTSLPSLIKENPIYLHTDPKMPSLQEQIQSSVVMTKVDSPSSPKNKINDLDL